LRIAKLSRNTEWDTLQRRRGIATIDEGPLHRSLRRDRFSIEAWAVVRRLLLDCGERSGERSRINLSGGKGTRMAKSAADARAKIIRRDLQWEKPGVEDVITS